MASNIVYQTLKDNEKPWDVEENGPFPCSRDDAWLGNGFYFWDYHIQLAHWWGKKSYGTNEYMICEAYCNINPNDCWDLHNEGKHREEFISALHLLIKSKIAGEDEITVAQVIEYTKKKGFFKYEAIRVHGINSATVNNKSDVGARLLFNQDLPAYFDLYPAIQLCLLKRTSLSLCNYTVVWPEHHREDYVF